MQKLREEIHKLILKFPFIVPLFGAVIGIESWGILENFIYALAILLVLFTIAFFLTKKFEFSIFLFAISFLFLFSSMEKDKGGKFVVGKIINLTPNSFIIQAEYVKKDLESNWEKSSSYIRIPRDLIKNKDEGDV